MCVYVCVCVCVCVIKKVLYTQRAEKLIWTFISLLEACVCESLCTMESETESKNVCVCRYVCFCAIWSVCVFVSMLLSVCLQTCLYMFECVCVCVLISPRKGSGDQRSLTSGAPGHQGEIRGSRPASVASPWAS